MGRAPPRGQRAAAAKTPSLRYAARLGCACPKRRRPGLHTCAGNEAIWRGPPDFTAASRHRFSAASASPRAAWRAAWFSVRAHDGIDTICEGTHERFVVDRERFARKVQEKAAAARV